MSHQQKERHGTRKGLWRIPLLIQVLCLLLLLIPGASWATFLEESWITRFEAPAQSMWSAGGTGDFAETEGYNWSDGTFSASLGVSFSANAGTVSGNVEGLLRTSYDDYLSAPGDAYVEFQYSGISNESQLSTRLGANLKIDMNFGVDFPWYTFIPDVNVGGTLLNSNPILQGTTDFTYAYDQQIKGTAVFAPTIGSLGFDAVVAGVNVDLKVTQDAYFTPEDIEGFLHYTHLETGTSGFTSFHAYDYAWNGVSVPLDLPGYWALSLTDLSLEDNSFYTDIGLEAGIGMWASILGEVGFSFGFDAYRDNPFALSFDPMENLGGSFLVYVDDPNADPGPGSAPHDVASVPEPGTLLLLALGFVSLSALRRQ